LLNKYGSNWEKRVRIAAISLDDQKSEIVKKINELKVEKLQHFSILEWPAGHPLIRDFAINEVPFVILVDKFGTVNFSGNPAQL
jgi:hypothetical protein